MYIFYKRNWPDIASLDTVVLNLFRVNDLEIGSSHTYSLDAKAVKVYPSSLYDLFSFTSQSHISITKPNEYQRMAQFMFCTNFLLQEIEVS